MELKTRKCRIKAEGCHGEYIQFNSFVAVCANPACAIAKAVKDREKKEAKEAKRERALTRKQKELLKPLSKWLNEAQVECNRFIRLRDTGKACISCGKRNLKKINAGHYVSVGSCRETRFHPLNINLQCEPCNSNLSGNIIEYRKNLIKKIGLESVEWLENHHDYYAWTIEDAKEIKAHYQAEIKRLK